MTSTHNPFLTTAEAADYLRLSRQFLEIARHRGDGPPYIKLARGVRYHRPSLDQWMLERLARFATEIDADGDLVPLILGPEIDGLVEPPIREAPPQGHEVRISHSKRRRIEGL